MPRKERRPKRTTRRDQRTGGEGKGPKSRLYQDDFSGAELDRQRSLLFGVGFENYVEGDFALPGLSVMPRWLIAGGVRKLHHVFAGSGLSAG